MGSCIRRVRSLGAKGELPVRRDCAQPSNDRGEVELPQTATFHVEDGDQTAAAQFVLRGREAHRARRARGFDEGADEFSPPVGWGVDGLRNHALASCPFSREAIRLPRHIFHHVFERSLGWRES